MKDVLVLVVLTVLTEVFRRKLEKRQKVKKNPLLRAFERAKKVKLL